MRRDPSTSTFGHLANALPSLIAFALLAQGAIVAHAQVTMKWVDESNPGVPVSGIGFEHNYTLSDDYHREYYCPGVAVGDIDNDGFHDLYFCNGWGASKRLYHNDGDGTFSDWTSVVGADVAMTNRGSQSALFIDYDADGDLDLWVTNDGDTVDAGNPPPATLRHALFRNQGAGQFEDVTDLVQMPTFPYQDGNGYLGSGAYTLPGTTAAGDVNGDGWLDIYVAVWQDYDQLLINNGGQGFTDVSDEAGIALLQTDSWTPRIWDANGDGKFDIHCAVDYTEDRLFINQGWGSNGIPTFVDVAPSCGPDFDSVFAEMGSSLGDYDNDGDFDLYITNIERPANVVGDPEADPDQWSRLFQNTTSGSTLRFDDVAPVLGVHRTGWGWGCTFVDYDNDGWQDLFVTNGNPVGDDVFETDAAKAFHNDGGTFSDVSDALGFNDTKMGRVCLAFDYDKDGDRDILVTNYREYALLYNNDGGNTAGNWIVVNPVGRSPNRQAIGAVVKVTAGTLAPQMRIITAGTSFLSQEPDEAHFGLASQTQVDSITVTWPDGSETTVTNQPVNQWIDVRQFELHTAGPANIAGDSVVNYTADLAYSDGTSDDVTAQATWTVEPAGFAEFTSPGALSVLPIAVGESVALTVKAEYESLESIQSVEVVDPDVVDIVVPILAITSHAGPSFSSESGSIRLLGTAQDNVGVTLVVWSNSAGGQGPCVGTASWDTGPITLVEGLSNVITVTARDAKQNVSSLTLDVTYSPPPPDNNNEIDPNVNENLSSEDNDNEIAPPDDDNDNAAPPPNVNTNTGPQPNTNTVIDPPVNQNTTANTNITDNTSGLDVPGGGGGSPPAVCGAFGMIAMGWSLAGLTLLRRRHSHPSRRVRTPVA